MKSLKPVLLGAMLKYMLDYKSQKPDLTLNEFIQQLQAESK